MSDDGENVSFARAWKAGVTIQRYIRDLETKYELASKLALERDRQLTALTAEARGLREALERIERGDVNVQMEWTRESEQREADALRAIARRALSATPAVPMTLDPGTVETCAKLADERLEHWKRICQMGCRAESAILGRNIRALARPQTAEPTPAKVCAEWCGTRTKEHDYGAHASEYWHRHKQDDRCFCSAACRDAGKPLNPRGTGRSPEET